MGKTPSILAGLTIAAGIFIATNSASAACALPVNKAYKTSASKAVYYVTSKCTKKIFPAPKIFFTYFKSWSAVKKVGAKTLARVPFDKVRAMTAKKIASKPAPAPVLPPGATPTLAQKLSSLAKDRIWFGHQSVGAQILDGVNRVLEKNPNSGVSVVEIARAADLRPGIIGNNNIGENEDPQSKLDAFAQKLRGGIGANVDLVLMKLCFVDFPGNLSFETYQSTIAALQKEFPGVKFLHMTAPLGEAGDAASHNDLREAWNDKLRKAYPAEQVFDIATLESMNNNGELCVNKADDGVNHLCLNQSWAENDGGHVNTAGADMLAAKFIDFLYRNRK
ncbi:hypothetical protein EPN28_02290 [Patescibacteria group bacterium]|nr:MAG: hypothetical protein EPN28_02290 [Patescibacteria group bacterium]